MNFRKYICIISLICVLLSGGEKIAQNTEYLPTAAGTGNYIKWIDFDVPYSAMRDAMSLDINSYGSNHHYSMSDILALLASGNGGNFSGYRSADMEILKKQLDGKRSIAELVKNKKLFAYYKEAYGAILGGAMGLYTQVDISEDGHEVRSEKYGFRLFSPIAAGYYYTDYDDFGASRSYGYKRSHLGHDLLGSVGTPIIAVESGYVEACGWNQYGGWRIGIRSFDGKRYYYYAHLRKGHPYNDIYEGKIINAGEVIGYLGMTGYSAKENVNGINTPHLHYGLQIIFDPSQKDGINQIWIDMYSLTRLFSERRAHTFAKGNEKYSKTYLIYNEAPD